MALSSGAGSSFRLFVELLWSTDQILIQIGLGALQDDFVRPSLRSPSHS